MKNEDYDQAAIDYEKCRAELIQLQNKKAILTSTSDRLDKELERVEKESGDHDKANAELEEENAKLQQEIENHIQRVKINTLLKEVDVEDLKLQMHNNNMVNQSLIHLVQKWESLEKKEPDV